jgi:hypothetical protein
LATPTPLDPTWTQGLDRREALVRIDIGY